VPQTFPSIAVVGAGAVGCYFGGMLARAGAPVTFIGRQSFVDAVSSRGLVMDTVHFQETVNVGVSTEMSAVDGAGLVLFCVKTKDNEAAARELAPFLQREATVLSLQNGVDNVDRIRAAAGIRAHPAIVYVAASVPEPGRIKHAGRGDLVLGSENKEIAAIFERAAVPVRISENIAGDLWVKLIWNCALNAISALGQARYGEIAQNSEAWRLVEAAVDELLAVAKASGIVLPGIPDRDAAIAGARKIATDMSGAFSSTAQDINRGRRTEIDSLNGYVARRGAELGIATPVNYALATLTKLRECNNT
jgi:2-dehydropantoate 2-reductase